MKPRALPHTGWPSFLWCADVGSLQTRKEASLKPAALHPGTYRTKYEASGHPPALFPGLVAKPMRKDTSASLTQEAPCVGPLALFLQVQFSTGRVTG